MHFELDDDQRAITDAVERILRAEAGPDRCRALGGDDPCHDDDLAGVLRRDGYLGFPFDHPGAPLQAALVVEATARACGTVAAGNEGLVVPGALPHEQIAGPVGVATLATTAPVRFAAPGGTVLAIDGEHVTLVELGDGDVVPVACRYGYPFGTVTRWDGRELGPVAPTVLAWWWVAVALELVGTARAALDLTVDHVRGRQQFGRSIGSLQAVQHRLAECEVLVQGARWLALEAAWAGADPEQGAAALVQALRAAERVFWDTHQFSGALGFATEYDLHLWTMRLMALRGEARSMGSPAMALTARRWPAA